MDTFELRGVPGSFRIIRREWDGYDRPDYTKMARLTDDEAAALTKCGYLSEPYSDAEKPVAEIVIDPATLLSVQKIDLTPSMITSPDFKLNLDIEGDEFYANCGPGVDPIPMIRERLIITLPELTEPFQRKLTKLVDPWWFQQHTQFDARQQKWLDQFRPKPPAEPWADNPTEATQRW
jgi:hypothetical protein